jgi:hypothetical protein
MPCKSCLVKCDDSITEGTLRLNPNLVLVDCPCRNCLVRIMCMQSCLRELAWVLTAFDDEYQSIIPESSALEHLRELHGI